MKQFSLVEDASQLYKVMRKAKEIGAKCLLLNGNDDASPRKIQLFAFPVREDQSNKIHYVTVSYVLKGDHNEAFYTFDTQDYDPATRTSYDTTTSKIGLNYPENYLMRFLKLNNAKTGKLNDIRKNSLSGGPEGMDFNFYADILKGQTYIVHHKGNDDTRKWKYELSPEQEKEVVEAFARLFREPVSKSDLNIDYGVMFRSQYDMEVRESGKASSSPNKDNAEPAF